MPITPITSGFGGVASGRSSRQRLSSHCRWRRASRRRPGRRPGSGRPASALRAHLLDDRVVHLLRALGGVPMQRQVGDDQLRRGAAAAYSIVSQSASCHGRATLVGGSRRLRCRRRSGARPHSGRGAAAPRRVAGRQDTARTLLRSGGGGGLRCLALRRDPHDVPGQADLLEHPDHARGRIDLAAASVRARPTSGRRGGCCARPRRRWDREPGEVARLVARSRSPACRTCGRAS